MKDNKKILYPVYDYGELNVTISKQNKKLGNIPAFNTLAGNRLLTLSNGTILTNIVGTCGKHCKKCFHDCYAVRYIKCHHNSTVRPYAANTIVMRHDPDKLRKAIKEYCDKNIVKYFRFHTSGELESLQQFFIYCKICLENPDVIFYIYTKAFDILEKYLNLGEEFPNNLVINLSEWHGNTEGLPQGILSRCNIFSYDDGESEFAASLPHCPAVDKKGHDTGVTCAQCRRCMKKGNKTSVYAH